MLGIRDTLYVMNTTIHIINTYLGMYTDSLYKDY